MVQNLPGEMGWHIFAVFAAMTCVTTITFTLRAYVRLRLVKGSSEDWVAGIGWLLFTIFNCLAMTMVFHGLGQHVDLIPLTQLPIAFKVRVTNRNIENATNRYMIVILGLQCPLCHGEHSCEAKHSHDASTVCRGGTSQEADLYCYRHDSSLQFRLLLRMLVPMYASFLFLDKISGCFKWSMLEYYWVEYICVHLLDSCRYLRLDYGCPTMVHCPKDALGPSNKDSTLR